MKVELDRQISKYYKKTKAQKENFKTISERNTTGQTRNTVKELDMK